MGTLNEITLEIHGITFEFSTQNNRFYLSAKRFTKRAKLGVKYVFNYSFKSEEDRYNYFNRYISNLESYLRDKEERKEAKKQATQAALSKVKSGDIFSSSWGYDQTNVDFYQVIEVKGSYAILREIGQTCEKDGIYDDRGRTYPVKDKFKGEVIKKKIQASGDSIYFRISDYSSAYIYEIEKNNGKYFSTYH